jgi:hypothetical protein
MERILVALANGGLCNRLKLIVSAHRLAHETGRTLHLCWNPHLAWNADGNNHFLPWPGGWQDLFATPLREVAEKDIRHLDWLARKPGPGPEDWDLHVLRRDEEAVAVVRAGWRWQRFADEPDVDFLSARHATDAQWALVRAIQPFLTIAQPQPAIEARVDRFVAEHGIDTTWTGLHVRREHNYCRGVSLDAYCAAADAIIDASPDARFVLCCDSAEGEDHMLSRYGGRMVAFPKATHEVLEGIRNGEAVIDLWLLARTGRLIGPEGSTYTEFAWWLTGCAAQYQPLSPSSVTL